MTSKTSEWRPGPTVCRCCLTEGCYKDISTEYFWMGKREVYAEMLSDALNVSIAYSKSGPNSNSRLICEPCISRLRDAHDFKRQVLECEKTFMQHLDPGSATVQNEMELTLEEVKIERVKQEKKVSDDEDFDDRVDFVVNDDDTDDDLDNEPLMKLASKVPKKEKEVDLLDLLDSSQITVKRKSTASSSKGKDPPAKKAKKREIVIKPSASKATSSASKAGEKKKKGPAFTVKWRPVREYQDVRHNAAIILECSNICPFKWDRSVFRCSYCTFSSGDFSPIKEHIIDHPNRIEVLRRARNESIKADVTDLRCELCLEHIKDISSLVDHLIEEHDKPLDKKYGPGIVPFLLNGDVFRCAICGTSFDFFTNLNRHLNEHFPNSICPSCGKAFSHENRLKSHMLQAHDKNRELRCMCTKCGQIFTSILDKDRHLSSEHGILKYKCPYCNECFKSYSHRVKHINEVHDKNIEYPCSMCSASFLLSSSRTKHIRRVHIKDKRFACTECSSRFVTGSGLKNHMIKHGGERKYQCQVCKKAYARKSTLREHMRIHNNDRRFVCPHCDSAFVQNCSLKGHIKTHHPDLM